MSIEYFEIAGALFLMYAVVRFGIWQSLRLPDDVPPERISKEPGKPIDATVLSERLQHVRREHQRASPAQPMSFKQALVLEAKREEVARLAFFQKPPPPEPLEEEHGGMGTLLV